MWLLIDMQNLNLSEKICLLAFNPETGKPLYHNIFEKLEYGIAGGLLIELMQEEKICFEKGKVRLTDPTLTEDEVLNQVLFLLIGSENTKPIAFWLNQIVLEIKNLSEIMLERLVAKKYLKKEVRKLKFGEKTFYINLKPHLMENLIKRLMQYLQNERRPSFVYRGMICLLDSCGMYRIMNDLASEKQAKNMFDGFVYCPSDRMKKYRFLDILNREIDTMNRIKVYA